ncbi:MAG: F0F1 ATP synthase subunit delta [Kiloniellaceae bacterium]
MARGDTGLSGLAGRYALALIDLADEKKELDQVADDLSALKALIAESEDLRKLIRSPLLSRAAKSRAMAAILEKAGMGEITRRFILVVTRNRRLFALPRMIDAYLAELARRRGEITAEVVSATELNDTQQKALVEALRAAVGGKAQIDLTVDRDLIGGLIVKVGSRMVDNSLRSKLQRLQLAMKGVG